MKKMPLAQNQRRRKKKARRTIGRDVLAREGWPSDSGHSNLWVQQTDYVIVETWTTLVSVGLHAVAHRRLLLFFPVPPILAPAAGPLTENLQSVLTDDPRKGFWDP